MSIHITTPNNYSKKSLGLDNKPPFLYSITIMSLARYFRVTVWTDGFKVANDLGLVPDRNSYPWLFEWYYTFDNEKDAIAFESFLCEKPEPYDWIPHGVSVWNYDPRLDFR
jgi:hypothetical protein